MSKRPNPFQALLIALGFLTRLPVNLGEVVFDFAPALAWFPFVGLLIGGGLYAVFWVAHSVLNAQFTAILIVAAWAAITGFLHLDGLADCCDGLLPPLAKERRLEIMRDPHIGAFGVIGLVLFLLAKVTAVQNLSPQAGIALVLAPVAARWLLLIAGLQPKARPGGLGAFFAAGLNWKTIVLAGIPLIAVMIWGGWHTLLAVFCAGLVAAALAAYARRLIGGVTGDVFGCLVELVELTILIAYAV